MEYIKEFELAKNVVKQAGNFLKTQIQTAKKIDSFEGRDIKLVLDNEVDLMILKDLKKSFNHSILSEENGLSKSKIKNEPYWILDPIDGTLNYFKEIPFCCISLALWKNNEPVFGIIYDFIHEEFITGYIGVASWINNIKIKPTKSLNKHEAVLATGFPTYLDLSEKNIKYFIDNLKGYKKIRLFGSAALSLAYLALGRVDAYTEHSIKIWDVAAGIAILNALGKTPEYIVFYENFLIDIKIKN